MPSASVTPLVTVPREQFLRKEETRILSQALLLKSDPAVARWHNAVLYAEDLFDIHEIAAKKYQRMQQKHHAVSHETWALKAMQLKLSALDQLAHLVI